MRNRQTGEAHRGKSVAFVRFEPLLIGNILDGTTVVSHAAADVVHENVKAAPGLRYGVDHPFSVRGDCGVGGDSEAFGFAGANIRGSFLQSFLPASTNGDAATFVGQRERNGAADAVTAAGA